MFDSFSRETLLILQERLIIWLFVWKDLHPYISCTFNCQP